jgi:hypothetical protein
VRARECARILWKGVRLTCRLQLGVQDDDGEVGDDGATQRPDAHGHGDATRSIVRSRVWSRGPRRRSEAFISCPHQGVLEMVL